MAWTLALARLQTADLREAVLEYIGLPGCPGMTTTVSHTNVSLTQLTAAAALSTLVPELLGPARPSDDVHALRFRLFDELRRWLAAAAALAPRLIVIVETPRRPRASYGVRGRPHAAHSGNVIRCAYQPPSPAPPLPAGSGTIPVPAALKPAAPPIGQAIMPP